MFYDVSSCHPLRKEIFKHNKNKATWEQLLGKEVVSRSVQNSEYSAYEFTLYRKISFFLFTIKNASAFFLSQWQSFYWFQLEQVPACLQVLHYKINC